jgi:hypothetical protein
MERYIFLITAAIRLTAVVTILLICIPDYILYRSFKPIELIDENQEERILKIKIDRIIMNYKTIKPKENDQRTKSAGKLQEKSII